MTTKDSTRRDYPNEGSDAKKLLSLDTPEAVYLLGLLWADGYCRSTYGIAIECVRDDMDELECVFDTVITNSKSYRKRSGRKEQTTISIVNRYLREFLNNHGFENKSKTPPTSLVERIPKDLHYMWWRGFFDGDGNLYRNSKWGTTQVTFAGAYEFDWKPLIHRLQTSIGVSFKAKKVTVSKTGHKYSNMRITSLKDSLAFCDYIYNHSVKHNGIGLSRKHKKYLSLPRSNCKYTPELDQK